MAVASITQEIIPVPAILFERSEDSVVVVAQLGCDLFH